MKRLLLMAIIVLGLAFSAACSNDSAEVEITIPGFFFEEEMLDEIVAEMEAEGDKKVTLNDDGSLTYQMPKSEYKQFMKEMETETIAYLDEIKNSDDFISIKDITYKKDFSELTIVASQDDFENSFDSFAILGIGMTAMYYQVFDGNNFESVKVTVDVKDDATDEVFQTVILPDDLQDE